MRVFISADMEGISGVADWRDEQDFPYRKWMTGDVNAAVEGAFEGGADKVVVRDAHGSARNIDPDLLDPRAELCRGWGVEATMVEGVGEGYDTLFLVGYHSRYGNMAGVLSHTWNGFLRGIRVGDLEIGEIGLAALTAGAAGVPVGLVTGDNEAASEAEALLPGVRTAIVKHGIARMGGRMLHFREAHARIREAACEALERPTAKPLAVAMPAAVTLSFRDRAMAQVASRLPGARQEGSYGVAAECADVQALLDYYFCALRLASTAG